jgi:hypothetical protein
MLRILKPGGAILWFDFRVNNPANPHVCGVAARDPLAFLPDAKSHSLPYCWRLPRAG